MTPDAPVTTPWVAAVSDTEGPVSVRLALQLADAPTPDQVAFWGEIVGAFFLCAGEGCFSRGAPSLSKPCAAPPVFEVVKQNLEISTQVSGVHCSAWQVLIALALAAGRYFMPVASLKLDVQSTEPCPVLDGPELMAKAYPALRILPFALDDQRQGPGNPTVDRGVEIRASSALSRGAYDRIAGLLEAWSEVANGGYPRDDAHPVDNACDAGSAQPMGGCVVEFQIPNYLGDDAAFDALLNGLAHIHDDGTVIRHIAVR